MSNSNHDKVEGEVDNVKVVVRLRPLSQQEVSQGHQTSVRVDNVAKTVAVLNPGAANVSFSLLKT